MSEKTPEAYVEELKSEEVFDLSAALRKASYPTDDITIYLDGEKAYELEAKLNEVSQVSYEAAARSAAASGGITDDPEKEALDAKVEELNAEVKELVKEITDSALTFKLRGLAPKQWRLIIKSWERKIRPETKAEIDVLEAEQERDEKSNAEILAKSIVSVTDAQGRTFKGAYKIEQIEELHDTIVSEEFAKLMNLANVLTFANGRFNSVIASDADFLSKPSADQDNAATSNT